MPYSRFLSNSRTITYRLEVDFGSGWEDVSDFLTDYSMIESTVDSKISGLILRKHTITLLRDANNFDLKWTQDNLPIRMYVKAYDIAQLKIELTANNLPNLTNYLNTSGFEELIFEGLTEGSVSVSTKNIKLKIIDKTQPNLNLNFGSDTLDLVRDNTFSLSPPPASDWYADDTDFLPAGTFEETGGAIPNFRPKPNTLSGQKIRCNALFNYRGDEASPEPGLYTTNEMLKAIGCLGGYDKDGAFKLKKRVWNSPVEDWDLRGLEYNDSFTSVAVGNDYIFNSIDVEGTQFKHTVNFNPAYSTNKTVQSKELSNYELDSNNTLFFENNNIFDNSYICGIKDGYLNVKAYPKDEEGLTPFTTGIYTAEIAKTNSLWMKGNEYGTISGSKWNFTQYTNFAIEFWARPDLPVAGNYVLMSNRNTSDRGQAIRFNRDNRRLELVNHGVENILSNVNAFEWGRWQHFAIWVDQLNKAVWFYVDAKLKGIVRYTNNLVASNDVLNIGRSGNFTNTNNYFRGRVTEIRFHRGFLTLEEIRSFYRFEKPNDQSIFLFESLFGYFRCDENSGSVLNDYTDVGVPTTLNFNSTSIWSVQKPEELRDWESSRAILSSYSNGEFNQTLKIPIEKNVDTAYLKRVLVGCYGLYQKLKDIKENANNIIENQQERKTVLKSFYINDEAYAQTLASNLLTVYNNNLGLFTFKVPHQPRLMVGDIVLFKTYFGDKKGVVLEKTSNISIQSNFNFYDYLKVKVISNLP